MTVDPIPFLRTRVSPNALFVEVGEPGPTVEAARFGLEAWRTHATPPPAVMRATLGYLRRCAHPYGGWGVDAQSEQPCLSATYYATKLLAEGHLPEPLRAPEHVQAWLCDQVADDLNVRPAIDIDELYPKKSRGGVCTNSLVPRGRTPWRRYRPDGSRFSPDPAPARSAVLVLSYDARYGPLRRGRPAGPPPHPTGGRRHSATGLGGVGAGARAIDHPRSAARVVCVGLYRLVRRTVQASDRVCSAGYLARAARPAAVLLEPRNTARGCDPLNRQPRLRRPVKARRSPLRLSGDFCRNVDWPPCPARFQKIDERPQPAHVFVGARVV